MRRKIAFFVSIATTAILIGLRFILQSNPDWSVGPMAGNTLMLLISMLAIAAIIALSFSKKHVVIHPTDSALSSVCAWLCTFGGAIIALSTALDAFCWRFYKCVPPPAEHIYNRIDLVATIASLLFGCAGGIYLIMQGFAWMSQSSKAKTARNWLALCPVLWMWFRLARYEISYASTIDIRESFFDFAVLVFASLFFLQMARMVSGIGASPKNGLLIFALCTAMTALANAPVAIQEASSNNPIGYLLIALVDLVIGFFALSVAALQVFSKSEPPVAVDPIPDDISNDGDDHEDGLAWTDPVVEHEPLEPAFDIAQKLPNTAKPTPAAQPIQEDDASSSEAEAVTVDDLMSEIDSF